MLLKLPYSCLGYSWVIHVYNILSVSLNQGLIKDGNFFELSANFSRLYMIDNIPHATIYHKHGRETLQLF